MHTSMTRQPSSLPILHLLLLLLWCSTPTITRAAPIQLHGLNYNTRQGPDWDWNKCKSRPQVQTDLSLLKQLTNRIRILSLKDCDQGMLVTSVAREVGMQLWLGMWVGLESWVFEEEKGTLQYMIDQGMFAGGTVLGISVGSEAIYRKDATVDQMIQNMNEVYAMLQKAGITNVPVTIVDVAPIYSSNANLRRAVNVTMTNTFPFWEGIPIDGAVDDLQVDLDWLINLPESRNKPFVLGETGWPSDGFIAGVGTAGTDFQRQYFRDAYCRMHVDNQWAYYWFTGIDNAWRQEQDPENTIEGNFGVFYSDLRLKEHFQDLSFQCSDGVTYSFAEMDFTIPTGFTPAPAIVDPASCQAHAQCASLFGNCCPNDFGDRLGCCDTTVPPPPSPPRSTTMPQPRPTLSPVVSDPVASPITESPVRRMTTAPTLGPVVSPPPPTATPQSLPTPITPATTTTTTSPTVIPVVASTSMPTGMTDTTVMATITPTIAPASVPVTQSTSAAPQAKAATVQPTRFGATVTPTTSPVVTVPSIAPVAAPSRAGTIDESFPPTRTPSVVIRPDSGAAPLLSDTWGILILSSLLYFA